MKTVKQIADEIGVSKQAIFKKIKDPALSTSLQQLMTTVDGKLMVSVDGEILIQQAFGKMHRQQVVANQPSTIDGLVDTLKHQLEQKDKQLEIKDKQISDLNNRLSEITAALANTTESLKTSQALHAGTIQQQLLEGASESSEKKKWWRFWDKSHNGDNEL